MWRFIACFMLIGTMLGCGNSKAPDSQGEMQRRRPDNLKRGRPQSQTFRRRGNESSPRKTQNSPTTGSARANTPVDAPKLLFGKWVGSGRTGNIEFLSDGTFASTLGEFKSDGKPTGRVQKGTFRSLGGNRIEMKHRGSGKWPNVEVYVSPAELRLLRIGSSYINRKPVEGLAQSYDFRRAGKEGPQPPGDQLGGTADELRKALVGRWVYDRDGMWEFLPDGTFVRPYHPFTETYVARNGHTLEISGRHGTRIFDVVHYGDLARGELEFLDGPFKGQRHGVKLQRAPPGHDDDPLEGNAAELIVGKWQHAQQTIVGVPDLYEFRPDGTWESVMTGSGYTLRGTYRLVAPNTLELSTAQPKGVSGYHVVFTKGDKLGLYKVTSGQHPHDATWPLIFTRVK